MPWYLCHPLISQICRRLLSLGLNLCSLPSSQLPALKPYGEARETRPRLVPTLESTDDFKTSPMKQKWSSGGRSSRRPAEQGADFNPPIKTRTWENQADEVMSQGSTTEKFRSLAVYAEMKLQEALEKCNEITPAHQRDEEAPDRFRAACCLQVRNGMGDQHAARNRMISSS